MINVFTVLVWIQLQCIKLTSGLVRQKRDQKDQRFLPFLLKMISYRTWFDHGWHELLCITVTYPASEGRREGRKTGKKKEGWTGPNLRVTISNEHQAGLVGGLAVLQLEGEGPLVCRCQGLHGHLNNTCVLVKVRLVLLQGNNPKTKHFQSYPIYAINNNTCCDCV